VHQPTPAYLLNYILTEVVRNGTAYALSQALPGAQPLADKTWTTNDLRDSWYVGYGDNVLGVAWIGRDDNKQSKFTGSTGALQIWLAMMKSI